MKINTHNLPMKGIKAAAHETKDLEPMARFPLHVQISYNTATGEIYTDCHQQNNWSEYHDTDIVTACNAYQPMTMQQIADAIAETVEQIAREREAMNI